MCICLSVCLSVISNPASRAITHPRACNLCTCTCSLYACVYLVRMPRNETAPRGFSTSVLFIPASISGGAIQCTCTCISHCNVCKGTVIHTAHYTLCIYTHQWKHWDANPWHCVASLPASRILFQHTRICFPATWPFMPESICGSLPFNFKARPTCMQDPGRLKLTVYATSSYMKCLLKVASYSPVV